MVAFGLDDLVFSELDQARKSEWFQQDLSLAIVEAARNNQMSILGDLLDFAEADEANFRDAMFWAAATENEDIMIKILDKVETLETFDWNQSLLSCAAVTGSKSLVTTIAKTGFNLNQIDLETGQTALHAAMFWRQKVVVESLLNFEVDLSILDHQNVTPLQLAVDVSDPDIVQMLLERGAKTDQRTPDGDLLVSWAAVAGDHLILDRLILAGAQFNVDTADTETVEPIIHAARKQHKECIRVLLKHGANPCAKSWDGSLLYQFCNRRDTIDICRLLLEKDANPNETYSDKEMLLIAGLMSGEMDLVRLLIEKGAHINVIDPWEDGIARTPLSFAAAKSDLDMIELLIEKGAEVNYVPEGAVSALFSAARKSLDIERLELLLKKGAKIDWKRDDGWQVLHAAYDAPKSVKVLLEHRADVNAMCDCGTVTMMAARWGWEETLEVLVTNEESKPDLDAKLTYDPNHEDYGANAVLLAAKAGHFDCVSLLLEHGARLDEEVKDARFFLKNAPEDMSSEQIEACVELIEKCVEHGIKTNILDTSQNSVLHHLKKSTPVELVSVLIGLGAPIDNMNTGGWTPLTIALEQRNIPVAKLLLSRGARADIYNTEFGSLLHIACDWQLYGTISPLPQFHSLLKLLIRGKADPNMPGPEPEGETLLFTAILRSTHHLPAQMIARYLVEEFKVDINAQAPNFGYPLLAAISTENIPLINYLIKYGARFDITDGQGFKPCHHAAMRRRLTFNILDLVSASGIALLARDCYDRTPLHFASTNNWFIADMFIKRLSPDFDVNVRDSDGWTPLMWACRWRDSLETVQHLVQDYGADIWAVSNDGQWSPLKLSYFAGSRHFLQGILEPPEDKMERILHNGSKQVWDAAFHMIPTGKHHVGKHCRLCFMPIIGSLYICVDCAEFQLCFKCFPHRKRMHDTSHEIEELSEPGNIVEEEKEQVGSSDGVDDDELEDDVDDDDEEEEEDDDDEGEFE